MTVKELIEILQKFPEDKKVFIWAQKGFISYDEADYWSGPGEVNMIAEKNSALSKELKGNLLLEYLTEKEIDEEIRFHNNNDRLIIKSEKYNTSYDSNDDGIQN